MPSAPSDVPLVVAGLLLASAPLVAPWRIQASRIGIPRWAPFVLLVGLGAASLVFGLVNPALIAAAFFEG
jgi:hypothetical protein